MMSCIIARVKCCQLIHKDEFTQGTGVKCCQFNDIRCIYTVGSKAVNLMIKMHIH